MSEIRTKRILKAIRCCRDDLCVHCPLQKEICDELRVDMESVPAELLEMIEDEMEDYLQKIRAN